MEGGANRDQAVFPLTVFYDGSCVVCAREMRHYMRQEHGGRLLFVDISDPHFVPTPYGRSLEEFMAQMHVIDARGRFYLGVDAFPAIWAALPGRFYRLLGRILLWPGIHCLARFGYRAFARMRPLLPKRRVDCTTGSCRLGHRR